MALASRSWSVLADGVLSPGCSVTHRTMNVRRTRVVGWVQLHPFVKRQSSLGSHNYRKASGPPPTNVGHSPQASETTSSTVAPPDCTRRLIESCTSVVPPGGAYR